MILYFITENFTNVSDVNNEDDNDNDDQERGCDNGAERDDNSELYDDVENGHYEGPVSESDAGGNDDG